MRCDTKFRPVSEENEKTYMRKVVVLTFSVLLLTGVANAQVPSGNAFIGYSFYSTNLSSFDRVGTNGWEASLEGKVLPFMGIVGDFDGHYGSESVSNGCGVPPSGCAFTSAISEYHYLLGPRISASVGKIRPFGEVLVGAAHVNVHLVSSETSFATAVGGGFDYKVIPLIAWRLQADYVYTHFFSARQNNMRVSTGIVFRF
jgi:hypothetical protein